MASNNPSSSSSRVAYRGPTSPPGSGKAQVPTYDSDGLESDDDTLLALSSLAKMEASCAPRQNEVGNFQQDKVIISSTAILDDSADCIDIVQQAIDAAENALARCPKYERREALTELLMHAKLEQAKKVSQNRTINADNYHRANLWAAMLMQVQEMGRNYPKDPQVHQLVYLVQQCVARTDKLEVPEDDDHTYSHPNDDQQKNGDSVEEEVQQQEIEENTDYGRPGEAAVDVDVVLGSDDDIGYRITEDIVDEVSNQMDDENDVDAEFSTPNDEDKSTNREDTEIEELDEHDKPAKRTAASPAATSRLRVLLPILTANVVVKGVQVPRLPRGSNGSSNSAESSKSSTPVSGKTSTNTTERNSRLKFQFPEKELLQLLEDEEVEQGSARSPSLHSYRRFSVNSKITGTVPLRRKSFSMKRSPLKSTAFAGFGPLNVGPRIATAEMGRVSASPSITKPSKQLLAARRKSTTACFTNAPSMSSSRRSSSKSFSATKQQILAFNSKKKTVASPNKASSGSPRSSSTSTPPSPVTSTQTQMVLRVRERTSDGVPELVISKKPVHFVVWHWNDRCIRVPFMSAVNFMELGPAQHGIMLRQLRYVKSMMHELPWAKAHLRALLSKYTAKEVSKEELYPQLNALGQQVQREIGSRARQHRALTARKQRLTVTLTLATSVVNDTVVTKFGRRGRPHASRLMYDPTSPLQLRWRRKHGERSIECLPVDEIQVIEVPDNSSLNATAGTFGRGNKKAAAAVAFDPESCLSLVTATRSLDLQVASALHREWLANAIRDIVSFAQQYKAAKATTGNSSDSSSSSESMPSSNTLARRSRQHPSSRNVLLY